MRRMGVGFVDIVPLYCMTLFQTQFRLMTDLRLISTTYLGKRKIYLRAKFMQL